jgi:hypothetical protein
MPASQRRPPPHKIDPTDLIVALATTRTQLPEVSPMLTYSPLSSRRTTIAAAPGAERAFAGGFGSAITHDPNLLT